MSDGLKRTGLIRTGQTADSGGGGEGKSFTLSSGAWSSIGGGFFYQEKSHNMGSADLVYNIKDMGFTPVKTVNVHEVKFPDANTVRVEVNTAGSARDLRITLNYNPE